MENKIYIYTTKTYRKNGWYKIGQTTRDTVVRVREQDGTSNPEELNHIFEIPSVLSDTEIHRILETKYGFSKCRDNREWFEGFTSDDEVITIVNKIIAQSKNDTRPTYNPRFYQDYVNMVFLEKLSKSEKNKIDFALELAPRFGKTIWSIDLIKTLFTDFGYKICFLPTYMLTALSSYKKDFYHFNGYSDEMVYVSKDDDVVGVIKENYGKKMIIVETSLHVNDYEGKLDFVKDLPSEEKVCFMDEADFGTHRGNSQEVIRFIDAKLNVYMTGTAIERVTNPLENLEDNVIRWSYTDMLMVKKGEHPIQKYLAEV
jgi:hypothetical protein